MKNQSASRYAFFKPRNIIKSAGLALAAMVMGFAVSAQAGTFNIVYDGFCDGVSATIAANGVVFGTETGCLSGPVVGTRGNVSNQGQAITLAENHIPNAVFVIRTDHTWSIFLSDGSELQSGTWSTAAAGVTGGGGLRATGQ